MTSLPEDDSAADGLAGHLLAGRYRVGRLLGEGGMAVVYEGEHVEIGKRVAIKIVHSLFAQDKDIVERFKREARSASAVESEHIIQVFDAGHDPTAGLFMVMELLQGEDLAKVLLRQKMLDPVFACGLVKQAAHALEKAHAAGVVHRDLKPANIFLSERDDGGSRVKLVDFGIAKVVRDARVLSEKGVITRRGTAVGTPLYMSPEQAQGLETVDHRTDIYALGVVLFEAIAGETPLPERPTYEQMILQLMTVEPTRLAAAVPDVPPALDALVAGMLASDPDHRIQDMRTVRERLEQIYPEIRGSALRLKSVRPPASRPLRLELASETAVHPLAQTSPALAVSPRAAVRRRTATVAAMAVVLAAMGIGVVALVNTTREPGSSDAAAGSPAIVRPAKEAIETLPSATTAPTMQPPPLAEIGSAVSVQSARVPTVGTASAAPSTATRRPGAGSAVRPIAPADTVKADGKAKQVGGAGISQEF